MRSLAARLGVDDPPDLPRGSTYAPRSGHPTPVWPNLLRHPIAVMRSAGILTGFPSTTPFGLALGSDSPCAENRCAGTLGLAACEFFTRIIVTHVSIRTSDTSSMLYNTPSTAYRTLLYRSSCDEPVASVTSLSPGISYAQADSTSELLRFL